MSKRWVTVECERLAVVQLQRCVEAVQLSEDDDYRLLDAIRFAHLSMIAAMTAALSGTAGVGALTQQSRNQVLQAYQGGTGVAFVERTMFYDELLQAVMAPGMMEWSDPLELSEDELAAARCLDGDRKLVDHPKPTSWTLSIEDIRARLSLIGPIVRRLMEAVPHHYTHADRQLVEAACRSLTQ